MRIQVLLKSIIYTALTCFIVSCGDDDAPSPLPLSTPTGFTGEIDKVTVLGGTKNEEAVSVIATNDGGYAIAGFTQSNDGDITDKSDTSYDVWVLKFAADDTLQWQKTFGGTEDDRASKIIQTQDNGFAIVAYTKSNDGDISANAGGYDFWMIKLDALGNLQWQKSYGYIGSDRAYTVLQTQDSGFLITGVLDVTSSNGAGNIGRTSQRHAGGDYWAIKTNASGTIQWARYFGGNFSDTPYGIVETEDNGFILVGASDSVDVDISNNKGSYDMWVVKISNTGTLLWEKSFGGDEIDEARDVVVANDGNFIISGEARSNDQDITQSFGAADVWVIKINTDGDLLWQKSYGGSSFDVSRSISVTQDQEYIISGSSRSADGNFTENQGQNDALVLKIDTNGNLLWQKTIGGSEIDFALDAVELADKSVVVVGNSSSSDGDITENKGFTDLLIIKLK